MSQLRKRSGNWQAIVQVRGQRLSKTFKTKSEASFWAKSKEDQLSLQYEQYFEPSQCGVSDKRMLDVMQKYLGDVVPTMTDPAKNTSYIKFLMTMDWMTKPLSSLTEDDLNVWRDVRYQEVSPKTVKTNFDLFKTALKHSGEADALKVFRNIKLKRITGREVPRLTNEQENRLLDAAGASFAEYLPHIINFALATGMRRGEMLKLQWNMVDVDRCWLRLPASITKTGKPREIFITNRCKASLEAIREIHDRGYRIRSFFKTAEGMKRVWPVTADGLRKTFETARHKAGLDHLHWHDLRHEAISRWFDMGLTLPEVRDMSGHSTIEELSRYSHSSASSIEQKMQGE